MTAATQTSTSPHARLRVAVLYGGQSGEHEVSLMSAGSIMENLDETRFDVWPIYIDRAGKWSVPMEDLRGVDVAFPVLHGPMGEDGTVQGFLKLIGVPCVGASVVGSAVGMDKSVFKDIMRARNLPVAPYLTVTRREWRDSPEDVMRRAADTIGYPCFVKPANMGSSVGINKARSETELGPALVEAFKWDRKALIEWAVPRARELEVSVLGNDRMRASVVGEIRPSREFYDYEAKYLDKGESASRLLIPAPIPDGLSTLIREVAIDVAMAVEARGLARVDFLLDGSARGETPTAGEVYVGEINTMPGFTQISMYPKLWAASGIEYAELLSRMIELALEDALEA
ncbi:MAG: D-alanine--D-alanine ligase [Thermoflexales bacterium]|nr:D-alanine--D-alanine ligase [Thermoflexales bacterium]